jgi:hypothetical protein
VKNLWFTIFDLRFGRPLWCCPTPAEFWRLGCTLVRDLSTLARFAQQIVNRKSQIVNGMVRLPGMGFPSLASQAPQMSWFAIANCNAPGGRPQEVAVRKHLRDG